LFQKALTPRASRGRLPQLPEPPLPRPASICFEAITRDERRDLAALPRGQLYPECPATAGAELPPACACGLLYQAVRMKP
jgi:hypothetical protein